MSVPSLDRRALLQRALFLAGAAMLPGGAEALAAAASEPATRLLDQPRYALLSAVADTIVPKTETAGALDVDVPAKLDALLRNWASPDRRTELVAALDAIDAGAKQAKGKAFAQLTAADRHDFLLGYDAAALKAPPQDPAPTAVAKAPSVADPQTGKVKQTPPQKATTRFGPRVTDPGYAKLKELIVILYYFSEPALTQELVYEHSPGQWRPSLPVTPETRAFGGAAFM